MDADERPRGGTLPCRSRRPAASATLTINEGSDAADTSVGSFKVALAASPSAIRDAAGNRSSFTATGPADKAAPVPTSVGFPTTGTTAGLFQQNDVMAVTFTENVTNSASSSSVQLTRGGGTTTFTVPNVFTIGVPLSNNTYISNNNTTTFTNSPVTASTNQIRVTLAAPTNGGALSQGTSTSFTFAPSTTITDGAGNQAAGSLSVTSVLF